MYGGRKRSTVSLVQLIRMCRLSISATICLASSGESSFGGNHQAFAAHVDDGFVTRGKRAKLRLEVIADFSGVGQQIFLFDRVDHGDAHGAGQRAAAEGGAVHARVNGACGFLGAKHGAQRNAAGKRLGQRGHVGLDAVVLIGAPLAGAAHAGLNLIDDEQCAGGAGECACFGEELLRQAAGCRLRPGWLRREWRRLRWKTLRADRQRR